MHGWALVLLGVVAFCAGGILTHLEIAAMRRRRRERERGEAERDRL